jgi:hypothetical protein
MRSVTVDEIEKELGIAGSTTKPPAVKSSKEPKAKGKSK